MNRRDFVVAAVALVAGWITGKRMDWPALFATPRHSDVLLFAVDIPYGRYPVGLLDCMHDTVLQSLPPRAYAEWGAA